MFTNVDLFRTSLFHQCHIDIDYVQEIVVEETRRDWETNKDAVLSDVDVEVCCNRYCWHRNGAQITDNDTRLLVSADAVSVTTNVLDKFNLPKYIILDCSGVPYMDYMGVMAIRDVCILIIQNSMHFRNNYYKISKL